MAENFEPIVVRFVNETVNSVSSSKDDRGSGLFGAGFKLGGVFAVVQEVLGLVKDAIDTVLKPVKSVVMGILKLLAQLLRPIADMLILLLQPILLFLKPIIKVFSDIMRPFRTLAYQLMGQAGKTDSPGASAVFSQLAMQTILTGFVVAIMGVVGELLKNAYAILVDMIKYLVFTPLLEFFRPVLEFFGANVDEIKVNIFSVLDDSKVVVGNAIDGVVNGLKDTSLSALVETANSFSKSFDSQFEIIKTDVGTTIVSASQDLKSKLQSAVNDLFKINIPKGVPGVNMTSAYDDDGKPRFTSTGKGAGILLKSNKKGVWA